MKRFLQFSTIVLLSCTSLSPVKAEELDANGLKLKSMFQEMVDSHKNAPEQLAAISFDGDISVEKAGEYYAVTLPYATLDYHDGAKFEIGLIAINAAPHEDEGQWKMTFALPTPMNFVDEDGQRSFQLNIGGQRASGVWNNNLGYFAKLDANYQDIKINDPENSFTFTLPSARAVYDLEADNAGKWSGPVYFSFNDTNLNIAEQGGEVLRVGGINLNMEMFKYDPTSFKDYQSKIETLILQTENQEQTETPPDISGIFDSLMTLMGDGFTSEYQISDVMIKSGSKNENFDTIALDKANFGLDLTGFIEDSVALDFRMGYDGFDIMPIPADMPDLAPKTLNLDISLQNIPFKQISELGKNTAEMAVSNPQMAQMAGMSVLFKLPAILSEAGTSLVLDQNGFGNDDYNVSLDGKIVTDLQAVNSATADFKGIITGMDTVVASLNETMQKDPNGQNASFIQQILMGLTMAKGFAKVETGADGKPAHVYNFIMNPQGQMLLNGNDMSALMGGGMGTAAPPAQQAQ